jgi:hypothetical protein
MAKPMEQFTLTVRVLVTVPANALTQDEVLETTGDEIRAAVEGLPRVLAVDLYDWEREEAEED